eukprot:Polyplicarium_translucidae@DN2930_c0_g1_i1.p1
MGQYRHYISDQTMNRRSVSAAWGLTLSLAGGWLQRSNLQWHFWVAALISTVGGFVVHRLVPSFAVKLRDKGLWGVDLNKAKPKEGEDQPRIPESLGIVPASVFAVCAISSQLLFSSDPSKLLEYNAGLVAIVFMTFLGFADDVIDLRWRYKMILPFFAALPLAVSYKGGTFMLVPHWLRPFVGGVEASAVDLGIWYYLYMIAVSIFFTNAINIYAGLNGLEVSQSLVACAAVILHNLLELFRLSGDGDGLKSHHLFSLLLSLPFFSCNLALLTFNWYPSRVFVGDSFTYFAGTYFSVVGILGHLSKTLVLFFFPQMLNFAISLPQLLGVIPCPRHRVPRLNEETGLLESSGNLTLPNIVLNVLGPMCEKSLVVTLIAFQVATTAFGLYIRYSSLFSILFE